MRTLKPFLVAVLCFVPAVASCGGGGGTGSTPLPATAWQSIAVSLVVPAPNSTSASRKPAFVSRSTLGAKLTVNAAGTATAVVVDLSPTSSTCTIQREQRLCTISVNAPVGTDTFSIATYDQAPQNGAIPASAHLLGTGSVAQTITANFSGTLTMYIDAAIAGFGTLPAFSSLPADGASHTYLFVLNPTDFDNNPIVNGAPDPYMNPIAVTLSEKSGSGHAQLLLNGKPSGASATLNASTDSIAVQYDGGGAPGYSIGVAFSASGVTAMNTTLAPLYVTSGSPAFTNFALELDVAATSAAFTVQEANAPPTTAYNAISLNCGNIAVIDPMTQNGATATFSVSAGNAAGACSISVTDGTSSVPISVTNILPPTPTPAPVLQAVPSALNFIDVGAAAAQTLTVSESGYSGAFTESDDCTYIVTVAGGASGPSAQYAITPNYGGSCTISIADTNGQKIDVPVSVTQTVLMPLSHIHNGGR